MALVLAGREQGLQAPSHERSGTEGEWASAEKAEAVIDTGGRVEAMGGRLSRYTVW